MCRTQTEITGAAKDSRVSVQAYTVRLNNTYLNELDGSQFIVCSAQSNE